MMFKSATLKLTFSYLAVLLLLSISFSAVVYSVSSNELGRGLRFKGDPGSSPVAIMRVHAEVAESLEAQLAESRSRLLTNLVLANVAVLIFGGALSYTLARYTLRPIEETHDAQSRFTADASHELRTPLTAIQTETEVALKTQKFSKAGRQLLESNLEELQKLSQLSDNLLRLAQIDGNGIEKEPVKVSDITDGAIERTLPLAEQKSILIETAGIDETKVLGDKESLVELIVILVDNAIKYSPPSTRITVEAAIQHRHATIAVADEGMGIKASELPHLFERFYRADSSRSKTAIKGYGLGLSIAQSIAKQHGSDIRVASKPGKGSTFTVKLPLAQAS